MTGLPSGTVTFLFTDIEGSTRLLEGLGDRYGEALEAQRGILRQAFAARGGQVVDMEGDASFAVFTSAHAAVEAAVDAQRALAEIRCLLPPSNARSGETPLRPSSNRMGQWRDPEFRNAFPRCAGAVSPRR
jgi:class 3 adenylate cyclase